MTHKLLFLNKISLINKHFDFPQKKTIQNSILKFIFFGTTCLLEIIIQALRSTINCIDK